MIKTSEKTSNIFCDPRLNALSPFQETLYWRLRGFLACSGAEETSAEPSSVKSSLYPLKRDLRESQVQSALTALTLAGMIAVYPDDTGHPYLRLIGAGSSTSHGGDIGGDEQQQRLLFASQPSNTNGEITENVPNSVFSTDEYEGTTEKGDAEILGVTERDVTEEMERRNTIEHEAMLSGLPLNPRAMMVAERLAAEYSFDWLIVAIQRSFDAKRPSWNYVETTLMRARERGTIEDLPREKRGGEHGRTDNARSSLRRSNKTDAELDEELKKWGVHTDG